MLKSRFVQVLALLLVVAGIVYVAFRPGEIRLVDLPTAPRDDPIASSGERELALTSLKDRMLGEGAELRKARNAVVDAWRTALDEYHAGRSSLRQAELIELKVWIARCQIGEVSQREAHAAFAELLEREIERLRQLLEFKPPQASKAAIRAAAVFLARERLLAGLAEHQYGAHRQAQLTALKDRVQYLQRQRPAELQTALDELADFESQCPPEAELLDLLKRG